MATPKKPKQRNLNTKFTLRQEKTGHPAYWIGGSAYHQSIPAQRGRTIKIATLPSGQQIEDRRRLNPKIAGRFAHQAAITGTAKELYINDGAEARKGPTKPLRKISPDSATQ